MRMVFDMRTLNSVKVQGFHCKVHTRVDSCPSSGNAARLSRKRVSGARTRRHDGPVRRYSYPNLCRFVWRAPSKESVEDTRQIFRGVYRNLTTIRHIHFRQRSHRSDSTGGFKDYRCRCLRIPFRQLIRSGTDYGIPGI